MTDDKIDQIMELLMQMIEELNEVAFNTGIIAKELTSMNKSHGGTKQDKQHLQRVHVNVNSRNGKNSNGNGNGNGEDEDDEQE